jgi:Cdc6-like AAA superfamily ATPase
MRTHSTVERSAEQAQLDKLYQWLSPSDPSLNHNKALLQRHNGTGRWFVESQSFRVFKEGTMPFLWLYGIPGCGKTILCASIIEELKKESLKTPTALLYFYFDFNDSGKQTLDSALRSLFWQMSKDPGGSSKVLAQLFASCRDGCDQPSTSRLIETFHYALCEIDHIRIVLDALDECTTKSDLMIWLSQLTRGATRHVQIIATSRKEHDIEIEFRKWLNESATIPLRQLDVDSDIGAYVKSRLQNDPQLQRWQETPELQDKIKTNLMKKSNGM